MNKKRISFAQIILLIGSVCIVFSSCKNESLNGKIIITRLVGKLNHIENLSADSLRYIQKSELVLIDPEKGEESVKVITSGFYSTQSPSISYDGENLLFAGQQKENDHWQIWEMDLENLEARQITQSNENCTDPIYLPNGRFLYSSLAVNDSLKAGHSLYTCNLDGSGNNRITFNPGSYFASNVLLDGRVLTIGKQLYPNTGKQMYMIMRPDGTKAEMFYQRPTGSVLSTKGRETSDGRIVFIESLDIKAFGGKLVSITYNRPLHSHTDLAPELKGEFLSVSNGLSQKLLVSYRKSETERFSLYEFDTQNNTLGKNIYSNSEFDVLDAIIIAKTDRPKKLPSEVDMAVKTGLLLCQDINLTHLQLSDTQTPISKSTTIEVLGLDSSLGKVQVEADGSFFLKVMADKPFRIQTIDKDGHIVSGPGGWIWLRPNERQGCVGCHADPELVPQNNVPLAVKKNPVIIPVHINTILEKKVLLE